MERLVDVSRAELQRALDGESEALRQLQEKEQRNDELSQQLLVGFSKQFSNF